MSKNNNRKENKRIHLSPIFVNNGKSSLSLRENIQNSRDSSHTLRKSFSLQDISIRVNQNSSTSNDNSVAPKVCYDDRFIPRPIRNLQMAHDTLNGQLDDAKRFTADQCKNLVEDAQENYDRARACISDSELNEDRVLTFTKPLPKNFGNGISTAVDFVRTTTSRPKWRLKRWVPKDPERVLDAPELVNDFYLNVLDWGGDNCIGVGLGSAAYLWNANTGSVSKLEPFTEVEGSQYVSSVKWSGCSPGSCLALGLSNGETKTSKCLRTLINGTDRVPALSWNENIITCGSRRGVIFNYDVRIQRAHISTLDSHEQEICGLSWSTNGCHLASGGNDNNVYVWEKTGVVSSSQPLHSFHSHRAAVKALSWHPTESNILATGGGTSDHALNFWNVFNGNHLSSITTNSQISGILWNPNCNEFVTSHGHPQNQLTLWSYPAMEMAAHLISHQNRILGITLSPDGTSIASVAADETLRLWKCFAPPPKRSQSENRFAFIDKSRFTDD